MQSEKSKATGLPEQCKVQQWPGKASLGEETWSRSRLQRAVICLWPAGVNAAWTPSPDEEHKGRLSLRCWNIDGTEAFCSCSLIHLSIYSQCPSSHSLTGAIRCPPAWTELQCGPRCDVPPGRVFLNQQVSWQHHLTSWLLVVHLTNAWWRLCYRGLWGLAKWCPIQKTLQRNSRAFKQNGYLDNGVTSWSRFDGASAALGFIVGSVVRFWLYLYLQLILTKLARQRPVQGRQWGGPGGRKTKATQINSSLMFSERYFLNWWNDD